jgi:hypothetical protein
VPFVDAEEAAKLLPRGELRPFRLGGHILGRVVRRVPRIAHASSFCEQPTGLLEEQRPGVAPPQRIEGQMEDYLIVCPVSSTGII